MASRPKGFGLTAETKNKIAGKYNEAEEQECLEWIAAVLEDPNLFKGVSGQNATKEKLKDGVILCNLINKLAPGSVKKINNNKMAFKQMENIGNFLDALTRYGVNKSDTFQTVDLYEGQNMHQVIVGIQALGRKAQANGYNGPTLGPKESVGEKREFTEEQLRAGQNIIGLQMGSNKGATQAGQNFGKGRSILQEWVSQQQEQR